jgi:hypothetical protein
MFRAGLRKVISNSKYYNFYQEFNPIIEALNCKIKNLPEPFNYIIHHKTGHADLFIYELRGVDVYISRIISDLRNILNEINIVHELLIYSDKDTLNKIINEFKSKEWDEITGNDLVLLERRVIKKIDPCSLTQMMPNMECT